jgi:hypothetical protein
MRKDGIVSLRPIAELWKDFSLLRPIRESAIIEISMKGDWIERFSPLPF